MDAAFASGLEVSGLHNNFFFDEPKVYFMDIGGQGEPERLMERDRCSFSGRSPLTVVS
jgi:hypothetical protein